jgi:hypothetical protein
VVLLVPIATVGLDWPRIICADYVLVVADINFTARDVTKLSTKESFVSPQLPFQAVVSFEMNIESNVVAVIAVTLYRSAGFGTAIEFCSLFLLYFNNVLQIVNATLASCAAGAPWTAIAFP